MRADIKGDLSGMAMPGSPLQGPHEAFTKRAAEIGMEGYAYDGNNVVLWDLFGEQGHPIRTTISEMGPLLLARLLDLNETQEGVLNIAFKVADEEGLLLLNLDDLQAMLGACGERAAELSTRYGNVAKATIGTIQRQLLAFEAQGADRFFGEPALAIQDFLRFDDKGRGQVNILAADKLMASPKLYATFLLWLLSELFEELPEVGDPAKPNWCSSSTRRNLLFNDAPDALRDTIEQVVRLIRSKGVGVYFVTQNPVDIPDNVAGQLGNRVQHALRAFTPKDQKGDQGGGGDIPDQSQARRRAGDHRAKGGRSPGLRARQRRRADSGRAHPDAPAVRPRRPAQHRRAPGATRHIPGRRQIRPADRSRERRGNIEGPRRTVRAAAAAAKAAQDAEKQRVADEKEAARQGVAAEKEAARAERERRQNPSFSEDIARQLGRTVQRQLTNKVATSLVRGLLGGLFRGR